MEENRYRLGLCPTFLSIYLFLAIVLGVLSACSGKSKQAKASNKSVRDKRIIAELPKTGEILTTERALELCEYYGFNDLAKRIEDNPDLFKNWEFDFHGVLREWRPAN